MDFRERAKALVAEMTLDEKISQMRYNAPAIERLGIPAYNWWNEALHGAARAGLATVFPQAIAMAASFDPQLLRQVACAISDEARAKYNEFKKFGDTRIYQGLTFWSPNINLFRDPRWGRGHETYGEDPYLTAKMGAAFVKGLQGEGKYRKLDATLKHFAVHSGPEDLRHSFDARVSDEDLYGSYLEAFRSIIEEAKPAAVMGAYNRTNGEPCCASETLLQTILRKKFGFEGYVVSDCGAIADIHAHHKVTKTPAESAALAVRCGCDLNCGEAYLWLRAAYEDGLVGEEKITESVERLMEARLRLGMFADDCPYDDIPYDVVSCEAHRALNRKMAQESIVLLKNNGILPLKPTGTIAVIGPTADDKMVLLGNYNGTPDRYSTLLRGIQDAFRGRVYYERGCDFCHTDETTPAWSEHPLRPAIVAATRADAVILCLGITPMMEGEEGEHGAGGDKTTLALPASELELLREIKKTGKPIVCVHVSGSCMALGEIDESCDAVVQCFYPGAEGGNALADILFGRVSPSGRLPVTFYRSDADLPPFEDYSMKNRTYRFFEGDPLYRFGHGLTYADIREEWTDERSVRVENRGGLETDYTVLRFAKETPHALCGIRRVHLAPGESVTVDF